MIDRYTPDWCANLFSDRTRYITWAKIEREVLGVVAGLDDKTIETLRIPSGLVRAVAAEETKTGHDVVALVNVLSRAWGTQYVHYGLTSSDIVDTGWALILREYLVRMLTDEIPPLIEDIKALYVYERLETAGRTHGQVAAPIMWDERVNRWVRGVMTAYHDVKTGDYTYGKLSGPVGNYAGPIDSETEALVLVKLGLQAYYRPNSQIVPLSIRCDLVYKLVQISQSIDQFAYDLWLLAQDGINEVRIAKTDGQVGSSSMAHKSNPILAERLRGQARLMRSYLQAMLESQTVALERDISHSSVERVALVDACVTLASMVEGARTLAQRTRTQVARMEEVSKDERLGSYLEDIARIDAGETVWPK